MLSKSKIRFFFEHTQFNLQRRTLLKKFIEKIIKKESKRLVFINYVFCTDKKILEINRRFLNHDFYTDILTFDLSEKGENIQAEIYISIERVRDNSKYLQTSFNSELLRVVFHGVLHLCDYRDKKVEERRIMRYKEEYYLDTYLKK